MNLYKKILISSLVVASTLSIYGCSNKTNESKEAANNSTASDTVKKDENKSSIKIEDDIKKYYDDMLVNMDKEMASLDEEKKKKIMPRVEKLKGNIPKFMELNQKAKNVCAKGYYIEQTITNSLKPNEKHQVKFKVSADGSSRSEEVINDKLMYLDIYSKEDDTKYHYEIASDKLDKTTKFSLKNKGEYPYKYGYFFAMDSNISDDDLKEVDYEGKKAIYAESISEDKDKKGNNIKFIARNWYDAETGIVIREEEQSYVNDKLDRTYSSDYKITVDQSFSKDEFVFDKEKLKK